ncbi:MAG: PASTA domain-containing protein, partial [Anaerolineae bacterium]|nr:PASTA domain-containing protein [Anaerolineae bacterium]
MPNVIGLAYEDATQTLHLISLASSLTTEVSSEPSGTIIGVKPNIGTIVDKGSAIDPKDCGQATIRGSQMVDQLLLGTTYSAEDALERIRDRIYENQFQVADDIRQFVNRYVASNPQSASEKNSLAVDGLVAEIHAELGLLPYEQPGLVGLIPEHVRDLVYGRAHASQDTARWAVHHAANEVALYSGQFVYAATQIFMDGAGIDFVFHVTYKNQGFHNGPLGVNWDHSYNLFLREVDGGQRIARLSGAFQESEYHKHPNYGMQGFNYWVPAPGEHNIVFDLDYWQEYGLEVPQDCRQCRYVLRKSDGVAQFYVEDSGFPGRYRIHRIRDRNGNQLALHYGQSANGIGSLLKRVDVNSQSRYLSFAEYDDQGRILCIRDHTNRQWSYEYDDFGDLVAFTSPATKRYPGGLTERYIYSSPVYSGELQHNLIHVYDTAGRHYIENEYGTDQGLLSFNRIVRQREGRGERYFEYEDIGLATGTPQGQPEIEEDFPVYQTVMTRRNGHPIHHIYNKFGNLIAQEEDAWPSGIRRRLVTHYRYNRDGAMIGKISPDGRETQFLYGRDRFIMDHSAEGLISSSDVRNHPDLSWSTRLGFGNLLAKVQRHRQRTFSAFQFPSPLSDISTTEQQDIIVKYTYERRYQDIKSISDPRFTRSPLADGPEDPDHERTLTSFEYEQSTGRLTSITYPGTTRDGVAELSSAVEEFSSYDDNGRLLEHKDRVGTITRLAYFPQNAMPSEAAKEGYLHSQTMNPDDGNDPAKLDLHIEYTVDAIGNVTKITLPKGKSIDFDVNELNQVVKVVRILKPGVSYETRYNHCRNMRVEQVERDVMDQDGNPLLGGAEITFLHYDENDNVSTTSRGSPDFKDHLVTGHAYDDGDLRVATVLPNGNRIRIDYDERRDPIKITRGAGSAEETAVRLYYDGDGRLQEYRDGRGLKTEFSYDSFGRLHETRQYDDHEALFRLIRHDFDKYGNITIERLFAPDGSDFKLLWHAQHIFNERNERIEVRMRLFQTPLRYTKSDVESHIDHVPIEIDKCVRRLYYYDLGGRLHLEESHGRRFIHDEAGDLIPLSNRVMATSYAYNAVGWPTVVRLTHSPVANWVEAQYDKHGMITRVDVHEVVEDSPTGEEVFTTFYGYDDLDRLQSSTDNLGNTTRYEYDSRDLLLSQIDPLENVTRFEYDIYGRKTAEHIEMTDTGLGTGQHQPEADVVTQFRYDHNDNLVQVIDAHGTPTEHEYDALDQRKLLRFVDGTATTYRYDGNGNVLESRDNNGLIRRTSYDPLGNPLKIEVDSQHVDPSISVEGASFEEFQYDAIGRLTRAKNDWVDISVSVDSLG